ncbi:unnamed protein product [Cylicocyclus nassatus]|uniref:Uncharacterized protein n=1 Tax=Cylicocyclus nassatus TaxID=53992 RepID=A0AA36GR44_CYLNA|nr:unnamed protein product [Cylicocyclus nassatus]
MSGQRKKSRSRSSLRSQGSGKVPSPGSSPHGNVATLVSVAVVNVDMEGGGAENNLERSKQQAEALAENACRSAAESSGVISSSDTSGPVTLVASRGGSLGPADSRHTPRGTAVQFKTKTGPVSVFARRSRRQYALSPKTGSPYRKDSTFEFGSMSGKPSKRGYSNTTGDSGQQDITTARGQESVTINTLSQQQRSALRKLDEVLTTPTQPRSQSITGSLFASETVDSETPSEHSKRTERSSKSRRSRRSKRSRKGRAGSRRGGKKSRSRGSHRKTRRYRGSFRRKSRRSRSEPRSSRSRRARPARHTRRRREAEKACRCDIIEDMEKGTLTEAERRDLAALLECPEPFCAKCIELKRRLDLDTEIKAQEEGDAEGLVRISSKSPKAKKPKKKSKYEYMPQPTMSSMGVKFCTCPECSRYRQQGEIIPVRTAAEITDELKSSQSRRSVKLKAPKSRWPESTFKPKSQRDLSSKKVTRMKEMTPIGSLHSTFPITLTETKQSVLPYKTPPRTIPIIQATPGTAGTKYWTPSSSLKTAKAATPRARSQSPRFGRARTPKSEKEPLLLTSPKRTPTKVPQPISTKWSSWLQEKTVPPTTLPARASHVALKVTERVETGKAVSGTAPPPKSLSQTSAGPSARTTTPIPLSSPRKHMPSVVTALSPKTKTGGVAMMSSSMSKPSSLPSARDLQPVPTPASPGGTVAVTFPSQGDRAGAAVVAVAAQTGTIPVPTATYIPERDYNPVCNCTNCRAERKIREENDVCDCYECIYEMRSSGGLKSAGKSSSTSSKKHPPRRMKAEYEWVKMLLHVQQPAGRYHTPKSKPVTYPWQKPKQATSHSHQSGGGTYRERSTSSHLGISATPESRTQSVGSATSSQATKQQLQSSTASKPSETPAKATSTSGSSFVTGSAGRTRSSLEGRSFSSLPQSDESDSWTAPSDEWTGSYLTPRSRSRSQRQSFKRR